MTNTQSVDQKKKKYKKVLFAYNSVFSASASHSTLNVYIYKSDLRPLWPNYVEND